MELSPAIGPAYAVSMICSGLPLPSGLNCIANRQNTELSCFATCNHDEIDKCNLKIFCENAALTPAFRASCQKILGKKLIYD